MYRKIGVTFLFLVGLPWIGSLCFTVNTQAAPFSQSEATIIFSDTQPPSGENEFDTAGSPVTSIALDNNGRDNGTVASSADWWRLSSEADFYWDENFHDAYYTWSATETDFLITAPGSASIEFTWDSALDIAGQGATGNFGAYSDYEVRDLSNNLTGDEYQLVTGYGHNETTRTFSFDYDFTLADIGQTLSIYRNIDIGNWGLDSVDLVNSGSFADFSVVSTLDVTAMSGGLEQIGAGAFPGQPSQPPGTQPPPTNPPAPVPEPSTLFLFGCGLIGLAQGAKMKFLKNTQS